MRDAKKIAHLGLTVIAHRAALDSKASKLDQARLIRLQGQHKTRLTAPLSRQEVVRVRPMLKSHDRIVGISDDDEVAGRAPLAPRVNPDVLYVMKIDVGQKRRDHHPL
jgi:hypothetical protein